MIAATKSTPLTAVEFPVTTTWIRVEIATFAKEANAINKQHQSEGGSRDLGSDVWHHLFKAFLTLKAAEGSPFLPETPFLEWLEDAAILYDDLDGKPPKIVSFEIELWKWHWINHMADCLHVSVEGIVRVALWSKYRELCNFHRREKRKANKGPT